MKQNLLQKYDAFLFDWDGTLATTLDSWLTAIRETYQKFDVLVDDEVIIDNFGDWYAVLNHGLPKDRYPAYREALEKHSYELVTRAPLYDGAAEALNLLKLKHKKIGLVTSSMQDVMQAVLGHHEIFEMFDVVVTGNDVENHKPHPESIQLALKQLNIGKEKALMIGDSKKDLEAANNAGVDSLLFYPESNAKFHKRAPLDALHPTYEISTWKEF